jgi:hypothetical protein
LGQRGQGNLVLYGCACTRLPTLPPEEFGDVFGGANKPVGFTRLIGAPEPMFERSFFETSAQHRRAGWVRGARSRCAAGKRPHGGLCKSYSHIIVLPLLWKAMKKAK